MGALFQDRLVIRLRLREFERVEIQLKIHWTDSSVVDVLPSND
jgi:hypothetical protein